MIGVGIDVSKLKSTICITNEYGEVLKAPYEMHHHKSRMSSHIVFRYNLLSHHLDNPEVVDIFK